MVGAILRITDALTRYIHTQSKLHIGTNPLCYISALTARKIHECLVATPKPSVKEDSLLDPAVVEVSQSLDH